MAEGRPQNLTALLLLMFCENKGQEGKKSDGCVT